MAWCWLFSSVVVEVQDRELFRSHGGISKNLDTFLVWLVRVFLRLSVIYGTLGFCNVSIIGCAGAG